MTRRILLGFLVFAVVVVVMLVVPLGLANARRQHDEVSAQLERDAFTIASIAEEHMEVLDPPAVREVLEHSGARVGASITIVSPEGRVVATDDPRVDVGARLAGPEMRAALAGRVGTDRRRLAGGGDGVFVAVPVNSAGSLRGAVRAETTSARADERIARFWWALVGASLVAIAIALGIGYVIARSIARPLGRVEDTAALLGAGELDARAPATGPPEVRALAETLNDMADRVTTLLDAQEAFVADASHQLRTPLTALRLRLENIETAAADADPVAREEAARDAAAALREVDRLSRMVDGLLALARPDREVASPDAPVDLAPLLAEACATWAPIADDQGVRLVEGAAAGPLRAVASPDRVGQVLDNLVANAIDASPAGGRIEVHGEAVGDRVVLHVVDDGPGLDDRDRQRAFDRFWRASERRGPQSLGGSGLGLAIVRKLAHADGATAELRPVETGGIDAAVAYRSAT